MSGAGGVDVGGELETPGLKSEPARLAALAACAIMDTPRETHFDNIVFTAAQLFRAPFAALVLVADTRVWSKAAVGPLPRESGRDSSFEGAVIENDQLLLVEDAIADPRFSAFRTVTGEPFIRFVAGAPVRGPGAHRVGALCIFDRLPRNVPERQRVQLLQLAQEAGDLLRQRVPDLNLDLIGL